ncbi:MAG: NAD-binding protein, partial [Pseudomonadota bacterium]|nr:NAD-binding protein [Pseudomonadota bacterium]
ICRLATFEVISLLVIDGLDPQKAVDIIQESSGRNYATEITLPDNILSGKMEQGFTTSLMHKDSGVALNMANLHNLEMPLGTLARELLSQTGNEFGWEADLSTVALSYETRTGARIRPSGKEI